MDAFAGLDVVAVVVAQEVDDRLGVVHRVIVAHRPPEHTPFDVLGALVEPCSADGMFAAEKSQVRTLLTPASEA
ncbi:hypothetical protein GCM10010502_61990 [Kitasatospora aureofaciens]|uniref:Uncharacterized protein n=1 Tax=Kitasatospora aureofaciens TaxID=1894 RepID=A0A8H9LTS5_KITAU|nr:hypothetical protein GCM10010502_61990 [Kitasatospora aureofaciens]